MFEGMKRLQQRHGLTVDGIAKPGGPTETVLKADLARLETGTNPARTLAEETARTLVSEPAGDADDIAAIVARTKKKQAAWDTRWPQPKTKTKPKPAAAQPALTLRGGVGLHQPNAPADVLDLKQALAVTGHYLADAARRADPTPEPDLNVALTAFQRDFNLTLDGVSLPGGETERRLNEIAGPIAASNSASPDPADCARAGEQLRRLKLDLARREKVLRRHEKRLKEFQKKLEIAKEQLARLQGELQEKTQKAYDACSILYNPKAVTACVVTATGYLSTEIGLAFNRIGDLEGAVDTQQRRMSKNATRISEIYMEIDELNDILAQCGR